MIVDIPYYPHHGHGLDVPDIHIGQVSRAYLFEISLETQSLNLVKNWIKPLTKLVGIFGGVRLELYELSN